MSTLFPHVLIEDNKVDKKRLADIARMFSKLVSNVESEMFSSIRSKRKTSRPDEDNPEDTNMDVQTPIVY
eukprot:c13534_g1_i1 orf=33-242(+)